METWELERSVERRVVCAADRPITFAEFLEMPPHADCQLGYELIDGVLIERPMAASLTHEKLASWLRHTTAGFIEARDLGFVIGSRTPVEISTFGGRMPDLLFVRKERLAIVQEKGIFGAPDLVVEIVSPGDRRADLSALEAAYRSLGVREIVFLDPQKQRVRALRLYGDAYDETITTDGEFAFETLPGFHVQTVWLLREPRPPMRQTVETLLAESQTADFPS